MIDVTMHRGFTKCPSCRGLATVIAVLLGCCEDSRQVMGSGPVGFDVIHSYTLSDSEKCGDSDGKQLKDGRCGNLGGALKNGGTDTCKGSATGYDVCVKEAADACSGDPACYSFIVPSVGHPGNNWATYAASAGNAAPNDDWDLYHKTGFMPCSACPGGGTPLPNSPNGYRMEWAHHCSTLTTAWNQGSTTKIFCGPPIAAAWGAPFLGAVFVACSLYVAAGMVVGPRGASGGGGRLSTHIHYTMWLEVMSLCRDGWAFVQAGGRRRTYQTIDPQSKSVNKRSRSKR